jgi:hypothetical protein
MVSESLRTDYLERLSDCLDIRCREGFQRRSPRHQGLLVDLKRLFSRFGRTCKD